MSGSAEVIVLLELLVVLERRGRGIDYGKIEIGIDYRRAHKKIMSAIKKSNEYAKESGAEIARIKRLLKKIKFDIEIKLIRGHKNNIGEYRRNPTKHLIKNCDTKARIKRENIEKEEIEKNIK